MVFQDKVTYFTLEQTPKKESFVFLLLTIGGMCSFIIDSWEKISLDKKSLQIQAKSCDFILNPGLKPFSLYGGLVS